MKKILFVLSPVVFALIAFFGVTLVLSQLDAGKGALQVTSVPQSNVYMNNKFIGQTPLCKCDGQNLLPTGTYTIRLIPVSTALSDQPFEQKITISKSVLTVVDRTFGTGATSQGSIITLTPLPGNTKNSSLSVTSFPSDVSVALDGNTIGSAPLTQNSVVESDHDLQLTKPGYQDKTIRIHTVNGYLLSVIAFLAIDPNALSASPSAQVASSSASVPQVSKVTILDTPTGFLRVRNQASINGIEVGQVKPGEQYEFIAEQTGWTEIKLANGKEGWVSSTYVEKQ